MEYEELKINVEKNLIKEIKKIAKRNELSLNDYIEMLLRDDLEAERYALRKIAEEKNK